MKSQLTTEAMQEKLAILEKLIGLSVDLHNLNAGVQRRYDISVVQWLVLKKIVDQPGLSAGTLAEISGVQPSTLTPTINRLESMGLIYIQERPSDLRRKLLVVTWKGLECSRRSEAAFAAALSKTGKLGISNGEFESVRSLTKLLLSNIHRVDANSSGAIDADKDLKT